MGVARALLVLVTVAAVTVSAETYTNDDDKVVANEERLYTVCSDKKMEIHIRKDHEKMTLRGAEPECQAKWGDLTLYDGTVIRVKTWTLPLIEGQDGPCGLRYRQFNGTGMSAHIVTVFGPTATLEREAKCLRTGLLDKRGAHIRLETIVPALKNVTAPKALAVDEDMVAGKVEFLRGTTLSATFHSRFPKEARISLHPLRCWIVNEQKKTRRLVVDKGCPVKFGKYNRTAITLGAETVGGAAGDTTHLFFNAEEALFDHENPSSLPPFHLQCEVIPCRGVPLFSQAVGIRACPTISWCEHNRELTYKPKDSFEINLPFSVSIADSSVEPSQYRDLGMAIYPPYFWQADNYAREQLGKTTMEERKNWLTILAVCVSILVFVLIIVGCVFVCKWRDGKRMRAKTFASSPVEKPTERPLLLTERPERPETSTERPQIELPKIVRPHLFKEYLDGHDLMGMEILDITQYTEMELNMKTLCAKEECRRDWEFEQYMNLSPTVFEYHRRSGQRCYVTTNAKKEILSLQDWRIEWPPK